VDEVADTTGKHLEGTLAHRTSGGLSIGYLEGLNSVFSAVKRKACGYRSSEHVIAMLYFVAGKLNIPSPCSHSKQRGTRIRPRQPLAPRRRPCQFAGKSSQGFTGEKQPPLR